MRFKHVTNIDLENAVVSHVFWGTQFICLLDRRPINELGVPVQDLISPLMLIPHSGHIKHEVFHRSI